MSSVQLFSLQVAVLRIVAHCKCRGCRDKAHKALRRLTRRRCRCEGCHEHRFFCRNEVEECDLDWKEQRVTVKGRFLVEEVVAMVSAATGKHTEVVKVRTPQGMAGDPGNEEGVARLQTLALRAGARCLCRSCHNKICEVLATLSGVHSYCVDMKEQRITITGCFDSCKLIHALVCRTGMHFEAWGGSDKLFKKECCSSVNERGIDKSDSIDEPEKQLDTPPSPEEQIDPDIVKAKSDPEPGSQAATLDNSNGQNHVPPQPAEKEPEQKAEETDNQSGDAEVAATLEQQIIQTEVEVEDDQPGSAQERESEHSSVVKDEPKMKPSSCPNTVIPVEEPEKGDEEDLDRTDGEESLIAGIYEREGCTFPHPEHRCCEECVRRYYYGRHYTCFSDDSVNCCVM